jgi:SAM-dependent methyltransferase
MFPVDHCPVCSGRDLEPYALNKWRAGSLHFAQAKCIGCGLLIAQPQASEPDAHSYYAKYYYERHWPDADELLRQNRLDHSRYELPIIQRLWAGWQQPTKATLVEIGCGYGAMLDLFRECGYAVTGCEMSPRAVASCVSRGLTIVQAKSPGLPFREKTFDVAVALQVIEHVHDPRAFARDLIRLAKPGGLIVIATEDAVNAQYRWDRFRARCAGRIPPFRSSTDHTFVFRADHLVRLMQDEGCGEVRTAAFSYVPFERFHWRAYKGLFRVIDRLSRHGDFLIAVGRRT